MILMNGTGQHLIFNKQQAASLTGPVGDDRINLERNMSRQAGKPTIKIFLRHLEWLRAQGSSYKRQAASCKRQAASLIRLNYAKITKYK